MQSVASHPVSSSKRNRTQLSPYTSRQLLLHPQTFRDSLPRQAIPLLGMAPSNPKGKVPWAAHSSSQLQNPPGRSQAGASSCLSTRLPEYRSSTSLSSRSRPAPVSEPRGTHPARVQTPSPRFDPEGFWRIPNLTCRWKRGEKPNYFIPP